MLDLKRVLKRVKRNAFAFALTFLVSLTLSNLYPAVRNFVSWHVQYQLCQAAAKGNTTRVNLLILAGANPDGFNTTYRPLHFAARYGHEETARLLLDAGADVNAIGNWKQTALTEAVQARDLASVQLLLSRGAAVNHVDEQNHTPLWYATRSPEKAQVRILINQGGRY